MDSTIIAAFIGASASIVAALIASRKPRGHESNHQPPTDPSTPTSDENPPDDLVDSGQLGHEAPRFTVQGEVIRTIGTDLGVRVENEQDLREFWRIHQIATDLNWFGKGPPVVSIGRKADASICKIGDRVSLTFVVVDRGNGKRGIKTIDFKRHPRSS